MANAITAFNPAYWMNEMQPTFYKESVALGIANVELRSDLKNGDTLHKPYRSALKDQAYVKATDITVQDVSATDEYLVVDTARIVPFYVDDLDKIQNKWDAVAEFAMDGMRRLNNVLDRAILNEYSNAKKYVDAGDVGGSAGSNISMSTSNIHKVFTRARVKISMMDVPMSDNFAIVGANMMEIINQYLAARNTVLGDDVNRNGYMGKFMGWNIYFSNNLPYSANLSIATLPTATDTVVVNGVTFTFVASIGTTAGNVLRGADAAASRANLIAAINAASGAGTTYVEPSVADREILVNSGIVAAAGSGTNITLTGYGDISVAETFTDGTDAWSAQTQHTIFGVKGAISLVTQKSPSVEFRVAEKRLGRYVYPWMLYGKKTFEKDKRRIVDIRISAASF